ncbi:MAG: pitrilysin family protein [Bacilli bacterium]|nr:pitrilysin family protein [Bacilli bacterium]
MTSKKVKGTDLTLYYLKLENGLNLYLVPNNTTKNVFATFTVRFGSSNSSINNINYPLGIAHFLEHKLFEQKNGIDPFMYFAKTGSKANAFTTKNQTTYLVSTSKNVNKNIKFLLDYVQDPYFTKENVEKEMGIIAEEIKRNLDIPLIRVNEVAMRNTFVNHPYRYPVIGNLESIKDINEKKLYDCYNNFYKPSNMALIVTGGIDVSKIKNAIVNNQKIKNSNYLFTNCSKVCIEPLTVLNSYEEVLMPNVTIPKVKVNYKISIKDFENISFVDLYNYIYIYFKIKIGYTSTFYENLKRNNLISEPIFPVIEHVDDFLIVGLLSETKEYNKIIELLDKELVNKKIAVVDFNRNKKVLISNEILMTESIYSINYSMIDDFIEYGEVIINKISKIRALSFDKMSYIINNLNIENKSICVVKGDNLDL